MGILEEAISTGALVGDGDRVLAALSGSQRLVAYDNKGQPLWQRSIGQNTSGAGLNLAPKRGILTKANLPSSGGTRLTYFDRSCGLERWKLQLDGTWLIGQSVAVGTASRIAMLLTKRNTFLRIQALSAEGNKLWRHDFEPVFGLASFEDAGTLRIFGPVGADDALHVLRCQHTKTGFRNLLEAFDMKTGARLNRAELPFLGCVAKQAVLLNNGLLVTMRQDINENAHVVAIQTKSPGLAKTVWPTFCADNARSCNASIALSR